MENRRPPLTTEAHDAVFMTAATVATATFGLVSSRLGGGAPVLVMAILLTATTGAFTLQGWRQALRHGWRTSSKDDEGEDGPPGGGGGPARPPEPDGPPGGAEIDWEQFSSEFWEHVSSRERTPV